MTNTLPAWEPVRNTDGDLTHRMRVPGGWIYRSIVVAFHKALDLPDVPTMAMVFVPMPAYTTQVVDDKARQTPDIVSRSVNDPTEGL